MKLRLREKISTIMFVTTTFFIFFVILSVYTKDITIIRTMLCTGIVVMSYWMAVLVKYSVN